MKRFHLRWIKRNSTRSTRFIISLGIILIAVSTTCRTARAVVVNWLPDADGAWETAANWSSNPSLPGPADDVVIDVGGATVRTITVSSNQTVQSVTSEEALNITSGTFTTGGGTSTVDGPLDILNAALEVNVSGGSFTANGATSGDNTHFEADNGGTLSLPNLADYSFTSNFREFDAFDAGSLLDLSGLTTLTASSGSLSIRPQDGGTVDLSSLTTVNNSNRNILVQAFGAGSTADLSSLDDFGSAGITSVDVRDTSTVLWNNPTTIDGLTLAIRGSGSIATSQIATLDNSNVEADNATPNFDSVTSADNSHFEADNGGTLSLPNLADYSFTSNFREFDAFDAGSLLDLSGLTTLTADGGNLLIRPQSGGTVDLSSLATVNNPNSRNINIAVSGAGSTALIGNLFQPRNTDISVSGAGSLLDVEQSIVLRTGSTLSAGASTVITTGKHHLFETMVEDQWDMEQAELQMDGTGVQFLEIGSEDLGAPGPASDNFGIGQLTVGTSAQDTIVRLAEVFDNGNRSSAEALYLYGIGGGDGLAIEGGSTLVIGTYTEVYNVYANIGGVMTHLNSLFGINDMVIPFDNGFLALEPQEPRPLLGDMDLDGDTDFDDIDDFVLGLQDPIAYFLMYEEVTPTAGDTDGDGDQDFDDIDEFVAILTAPPSSVPQQIPEPSTTVLVGLAVGCLCGWPRRCRDS